MLQTTLRNKVNDPLDFFDFMNDFQLVLDFLHMLWVQDFIPILEIKRLNRFEEGFQERKIQQNLKWSWGFLWVLESEIFVKPFPNHVTKLCLECFNRFEVRVLLLWWSYQDAWSVSLLHTVYECHRQVFFTLQICECVLFHQVDFKVSVFQIEFLVD